MPENPLFQIVDVSDWDITDEEPSGAEAKFWLEEPETAVRWLLKSVTVTADGHVQGEDWAEMAASRLGRLLGIPCAHVELAIWRGDRGCISQSLRPFEYQMQPGHTLLEICKAPGYVHYGKGKNHPGHSLENIRDSLAGALPPPGWDAPFDATAFDVFTGYVLFDAWIANQDRHDNNWSVLVPVTLPADTPTRLSGSYDHASSLAFANRDSGLQRLLAEPDGVERWCAKGTANRLEGRPKLVDAAGSALQLASSSAREYWLDRLRQVSNDEVRRVLARTPRMSEVARTFAGRVLEVNRRRVLDACG